jgi:predicted nucleotidyltransferase
MLRTKATPRPSGARGNLPHLLFGDYRYRVLDLLLPRPGESFHVREIARLTGVPAGSLHRELRMLAQAELLRVERAGNQVKYSANPEFPAYAELTGILRKSGEHPPVLQSPRAAYAVAPVAGLPPLPKRRLAQTCRRYGVKRLAIFGSAARGELRADSDVDLLVEFKPASRTSLFDLARMQEELSPLFGGRRVHIASPAILENPYRRKTILPDLRRLYEA